MMIGKRHLAAAAAAAAAGAALASAVALAACGSGPASPGTPGPTTPRPAATAPASPSATASAADVAFTTGALNLENQAAALAALAPGHTTTARMRQFADGLDAHAGEFRQLHTLMGQWGQAAPAPYTPGRTPPPGTGPGMMSTGDWDEMGHMHGADFNEHFMDAMMRNRTAEIAVCRAELTGGVSPRARSLARTMLTERQAELTQFQAWHTAWPTRSGHDMMHD